MLANLCKYLVKFSVSRPNNVCKSISIADPLGVLIKCFNRMFKPRGAFAFGPFLVTWCYSCFVPIYAWSNLP